MLGLRGDSYEAYCLDEAVIYFGLTLENRLSEVGQKPSREERRTQAAREALLDEVLGNESESGSGFADPALMFK